MPLDFEHSIMSYWHNIAHASFSYLAFCVPHNIAHPSFLYLAFCVPHVRTGHSCVPHNIAHPSCSYWASLCPLYCIRHQPFNKGCTIFLSAFSFPLTVFHLIVFCSLFRMYSITRLRPESTTSSVHALLFAALSQCNISVHTPVPALGKVPSLASRSF